MMKFAANPLGFIVVYLILMLPTYLLPWLSVQSELMTGYAVAERLAQAWCLGMLVILGWVRGKMTGKTHLPVFPLLAGVFDLVPLLNLIPFVPTVMHLIAMVMGAQQSEEIKTEEVAGARRAAYILTLLLLPLIVLAKIPRHKVQALLSPPPAASFKPTSPVPDKPATPIQKAALIPEPVAKMAPPEPPRIKETQSPEPVAETKPAKVHKVAKKPQPPAQQAKTDSEKPREQKTDGVEIRYISIQ